MKFGVVYEVSGKVKFGVFDEKPKALQFAADCKVSGADNVTLMQRIWFYH